MAENKGKLAPVQVERGGVSPDQLKEIESGDFITVKEMAEKLCYTLQWVRQMLEEGRIKGIKPFGSQWRIPKSEFDRILKEGTPPMRREKEKPPIKEIDVPPETSEKIKETEAKGKKGSSIFPFDF